MALTISDVLSVATVDQWTTKILGWCSTLNLPVTAWQPGGVARTNAAVYLTLEAFT